MLGFRGCTLPKHFQLDIQVGANLIDSICGVIIFCFMILLM